MEERNNGFPPFAKELKMCERSGAIKDIFEIAKNFKDFIIKKYAKMDKNGKRKVNLGSFSYEISKTFWPDSEPKVDTFEFLQNRKRDYDLLKQYLGEFMTNTLFVFALDEQGEKSCFEIQEKIEGKTLGDLAQAKKEDKNTKTQIKNFSKKSLEMFSATGWLPDVHGDVFGTDNLILNQNNILKFIDYDAIFKIPVDLFLEFKNNLYDGDGLNKTLLAKLKERGEDERYLGDIESSINSLFLALS